MKAIEIRDLHIAYKTLKPVSLKSALFSPRKTQVSSFEAVKGVSFDIEQGEILGVIGKNGSGKSTLLRALAGIFSPDQGSIDRMGHSVSLLSIGVGFQNRLSGRENIYLSGLLLGFTMKQIEEKFDEIVAFSELGEFIDMPVKTYSSGMYSKLAFSITSVMETDIILIDEVLSVGDARFKKKSYTRMKELISDETKTVVIVSHSMDTIRRLCSRAIWLQDGVLQMQGDVRRVVGAYEKYSGISEDETENGGNELR